MMKRIHRFFLVTIVIILQFHEVHSLSYTGILAGGHGCGSSGDGGPAFSAMVNNTYGVWSDTVGNVYFTEYSSSKIRVINSSGIIHTILNWKARYLVGDSSHLYIAGTYSTWRYSFSTREFVKIIGKSSIYSYGGDGRPATSANISHVLGLAISTSGTLYAADSGNCIIRAVNITTNIITTSVGIPTSCGFRGDDGLATSALLNYPWGIWLSSNDDLYIADTQNARIRRVTNNTITTIAGTGVNSLGPNNVAATSSALFLPVGVGGDSLGNIYIAERSGCRVRIVRFGIITTVLGTGTCGNAGSKYQVAIIAPISTMYQIWVNTMSTLYVVEDTNCTVRYVNLSISTLKSSPSPTGYQTLSPSLLPTCVPTPSPSFPPTFEPSVVPTLVPSDLPTYTPSLIPSASPTCVPSTGLTFCLASFPSVFHLSLSPTLPPSNLPTAAPSQFILSCFSNSSSWKEPLFLFGSFSSDYQSSRVLDASSSLDSPSFIIFGSKAFSYTALINVSCSFVSCHYPVAHISSSFKRDTISRAAVIPGDVNGDAYNDLIVCSPLTSICNIYFGKAEDGLRNVMIGVMIYDRTSSPTTSSQLASNFFGFAVAGAEDMNEDGLADVLVSSLTGKAVYVIYGKRSWSSLVRVSEMRSGVDGYKIVADSSTTLTGISVSGVGDMNGDGRKDVALSIQRSGLFMVYVVWGAGGNDVLLGEVRDGVKGFSVTGEQGYYTGLSITGLGDVNHDGLDDLLVGAIPYPDRATNPPQKSYVILGSSAGLSDIRLGGGRAGLVCIVGGGIFVSGPGDTNDDGIDDIMITNMREYLGKGNAYIISYPSRITSSPSLIPSSLPSSAPSHVPTGHPSSFFPSPSPSLSSSYPSNTILSPSSLPSHTTTAKPSRSFHPTNILTSFYPTTFPTAVPSMQRTTRNPSVRPSSISSARKSKNPSLSPSKPPSFSPSTRSPSTIPTLMMTLNPSSFPYLVRVVNTSSFTRPVIIFGIDGANQRFEISSMSSDGRRRSGWSGTIIGGRGRKVYVIYPKDPSQPVNRIVLEDFDKKYGVLDLSHISQIANKSDLTYLTNPLILFLPDNQKIVLSSCQTMNEMRDENFLFQLSLPSSSSLSSSSEISMKDLAMTIVFFGCMAVMMLISISIFSVRHKEDENKEGKKILMQKDKQDMPEDKQIDQEMNLNTREEEIRSIEDLQHDGDSLMSINSYFKDLDDISSFFEEVSNSTTSEYDEERGFL